MSFLSFMPYTRLPPHKLLYLPKTNFWLYASAPHFASPSVRVSHSTCFIQKLTRGVSHRKGDEVRGMAEVQGGPGPPSTQNFDWVLGPRDDAFGSTNNWPVYSLILGKISKIGATRCQMLDAEFAFRRCSTQAPMEELQPSVLLFSVPQTP